MSGFEEQQPPRVQKFVGERRIDALEKRLETIERKLERLEQWVQQEHRAQPFSAPLASESASREGVPSSTSGVAIVPRATGANSAQLLDESTAPEAAIATAPEPERREPHAIESPYAAFSPQRPMPSPAAPAVSPASPAPAVSPAPSPPAAASPFLTRQEFHEPELAAEAIAETGSYPAQPPEPETPWEVKLATTWLPRIGGVLLIIGVATVGALIHPYLTPIWRVVLGYVLAGGVGAAGFAVLTRHLTVGRVTMVIGLAVAYFVSFAAHYIKAMEVLPPLPSLFLMAAFAGLLVITAELWKSESTAAMGFALGVIAALVSARTSQEFSLLSLFILAIAAGILLVRNEWVGLTGLAVIGTYLPTLALWLIVPVGSGTRAIAPHLGALVLYHAVFTAAFWRWGRAAMAREEAAVEATLHDAAPAIDVRVLPYASEFAILNSIGLIGLSVYLFWNTKTLWPQVHWLLFGLAVAEGMRVGVRRLSRGPLGSFHAVTAFALVSAGIVSATGGLTESAVLAAQALAVTIAATRAQRLRFLRPLTAACAGLAISSYRPATTFTPAGLITSLLPGVLLLMSTLPWECIWVRRPQRFGEGTALALLESISGHFRAIVATVLILVALITVIGRFEQFAAPFAGVMLLLLAGIVLLRAWTWFLGAIMAELAAFVAFTSLQPPSATQQALAFLVVAAGIYLWQETARKTRAPALRIVYLGTFLIQSSLFIALALEWVRCLPPYPGIYIALFAAGCFGVGWIGLRSPPIPALVPPPETDDNAGARPAPKFLSLPGWAEFWWCRLGAIGAVVLMAVALVYATVVTSPKELLSASVLSATLATGWWIYSGRKGLARHREAIAIILATLALSLAILEFGRARPLSILGVGALGAVILIAGWKRRSSAAAISGLVALVGSPLVVLSALLVHRIGSVVEGLCVLGLAILLVAATRLLPSVQRMFKEASGWIQGDQEFAVWVSWWLTGMGAVVALIALAVGVLLPDTLVTVAWGAVGIALLAAGFALREKPLRFVSLGVFVAAVGRILFIDLAGASAVTRAVAFLGVGLLMVAAGVAYGFLRKRIEIE